MGPKIAINRLDTAMKIDMIINAVAYSQPLSTPRSRTNGVNARLITDWEKNVSAIS